MYPGYMAGANDGKDECRCCTQAELNNYKDVTVGTEVTYTAANAATAALKKVAPQNTWTLVTNGCECGWWFARYKCDCYKWFPGRCRPMGQSGCSAGDNRRLPPLSDSPGNQWYCGKRYWVHPDEINGHYEWWNEIRAVAVYEYPTLSHPPHIQQIGSSQDQPSRTLHNFLGNFEPGKCYHECWKRGGTFFGCQLKKNLIKKIFGYLASCEFWLKSSWKFWIL